MVFCHICVPSVCRESKNREQLSDAVRAGETTTVVRLVAAKADPNEVDMAGETVLFEACALGDLRVTAVLLMLGSDAAVRSFKGEVAEEHAETEQISCLLRAGVGSVFDIARVRVDTSLRRLMGKDLNRRFLAHVAKLWGQPTAPAVSGLLSHDQTTDIFDWGRFLWRHDVETSIFRIGVDEAVTYPCHAVTQIEPDVSEAAMLPRGTGVRLVLGERPMLIDRQRTRWVLVTFLWDEKDEEAEWNVSLRSNPMDRPAMPEWWVQWNDLALYPTVVQSVSQKEALVAQVLARGVEGAPHFADDEEYRRAWRHRVGAWDDNEPFYKPVCEALDVDLTAWVYRNVSVKLIRASMLHGLPNELTSSGEAAVAAGDVDRLRSVQQCLWDDCPVARATNPHGVLGRVSVLCPTHAWRHHLHESLYHCFYEQTWADKELVIFDTGGDPSPYFCTKGGRPWGGMEEPFLTPLDDPRVVYVHSKVNLTLGQKRNQLLMLASGELVAWFDDDNLYSPQYLSTMVSKLRASKAQLVHLGAAFSWRPLRDTFRHHEGTRDRAESFVHLRAPLRALSFGNGRTSEEDGFTSSCVCHAIDDDFGLYLHVEHESNTCPWPSAGSKIVPRRHLQNPGIRAMLARHSKFF